MGAHRIDLTGQRFGRLTVLRLAHTEGGRMHWFCQCDCSRFATVASGNLRGHSAMMSCGCWRSERIAAANLTHGHSPRNRQSAMYKCWLNLRDRCYNPKCKAFKNYGGRGIKVCERWFHNFVDFLADILAEIGERPPGMSLDRIDNDKGYEPGNVRWATRTVQNRNRRMAA